MYLCVFKQNKIQADENENMFILVQEIEKRFNKRISIFVCWKGEIWQAFIVAIFATRYPWKQNFKRGNAPNDAENNVQRNGTPQKDIQDLNSFVVIMFLC